MISNNARAFMQMSAPLRGNLDPRECGVCGLWSQYGHALVSGRRDAMGKTPCDNWVCERCYGERGLLAEVGRAVDEHDKRVKKFGGPPRLFPPNAQAASRSSGAGDRRS